jgi:hypothetical protein
MTFAPTCFGWHRNHPQGAVQYLAKNLQTWFYCARRHGRSQCYGSMWTSVTVCDVYRSRCRQVLDSSPRMVPVWTETCRSESHNCNFNYFIIWDFILLIASVGTVKRFFDAEPHVAITPLCRLNEVCRFETRFNLFCIYSVCEING